MGAKSDIFSSFVLIQLVSMFPVPTSSAVSVSPPRLNKETVFPTIVTLVRDQSILNFPYVPLEEVSHCHKIQILRSATVSPL